jgi:hypothetical protein
MVGAVFIPPIGLVSEAWELVYNELRRRFPNFTSAQIDVMVSELFQMYSEAKFNSINHSPE